MAVIRDILQALLDLRAPNPQADLLDAVSASSIKTESTGSVTIGPNATSNSTTYFGSLQVINSTNRAGMALVGTATSGTDNSTEARFFSWDGAATSLVGRIITLDSNHATLPNTVRLEANRATGVLQLGTNSVVRANITAAGVVTSWEGTQNIGTAGLMATATYETGSFTGTLTGCTTSPTTTVNWSRVGNVVTLNMAANLFATSNATTCTITGMPAALAPARLQRICIPRVEDNTLTVPGLIDLPGGSTVMSLARTDNAALTASGTKGFGAFTTTYLLT